jgi:EpsI family protein
MGSKINWRVIYVMLCLLVAAGFIYSRPSAMVADSKAPLAGAFSGLTGWQGIGDIQIEKDIVDALSLDDFLFRTYANNGRSVSLYIGYYRTSDKVGAAHSPLVCFPGQGWEISIPEKIKVAWENGQINAEKLIVSKRQHKELLVYWFQAYDKTSSGTLRQKINNYWARVNSKPQDNAFVRISVDIADANIDDAFKSAVIFIRDFYPHFLDYIKT